jgi:hypothetical protein
LLETDLAFFNKLHGCRAGDGPASIGFGKTLSIAISARLYQYAVKAGAILALSLV